MKSNERISPMIGWLKKNKFKAHLTSFLLMILSSFGFYFAASADQSYIIWSLLGIFVSANLIAVMVR